LGVSELSSVDVTVLCRTQIRIPGISVGFVLLNLYILCIMLCGSSLLYFVVDGFLSFFLWSMSVFRLFTASDYPFDNFKLFSNWFFFVVKTPGISVVFVLPNMYVLGVMSCGSLFVFVVVLFLVSYCIVIVLLLYCYCIVIVLFVPHLDLPLPITPLNLSHIHFSCGQLPTILSF
jgi:hypothetical protein